MYASFGMKKEHLLLGINTDYTPGYDVMRIVKSVVDKQYGGIMIWNPILYDKRKACDYYSEILIAEEGRGQYVTFRDN